jgi:hypothetical protein
MALNAFYGDDEDPELAAWAQPDWGSEATMEALQDRVELIAGRRDCHGTGILLGVCHGAVVRPLDFVPGAREAESQFVRGSGRAGFVSVCSLILPYFLLLTRVVCLEICLHCRACNWSAAN